jgi:hypothetical protein
MFATAASLFGGLPAVAQRAPGTPALLCRALATRPTSVVVARRAVFGWWPAEGARSTPFSALKTLRRRGVIGQKARSSRASLASPFGPPPLIPCN